MHYYPALSHPQSSIITIIGKRSMLISLSTMQATPILTLSEMCWSKYFPVVLETIFAKVFDTFCV